VGGVLVGVGPGRAAQESGQVAPHGLDARDSAVGILLAAVDGNDHALAVDNFSFTAAPEPASLALLLVGGLFLSRRR